jgi:thiamine pyrophosphokinase
VVLEVPLTFLREAELIGCCESTDGKYGASGLEPGTIVGDLDSVPAEPKEK